MGREVRRVPHYWKHPKNDYGNYEPLLPRAWYDDYIDDIETTINEEGIDGLVYIMENDFNGHFPLEKDYMPKWDENELTHLQMYETCTEGTPISPVMETPEELAKWLADNKASSFGDFTNTYEEWLSMIKRGWSISGAIMNGEMMSGVELCNKFGGD